MSWLLVIILVTLILLCWGGGYGFWNQAPHGQYIGGVLGVLGFILLIVLVVMFMGAVPAHSLH